jgi:hypothetical protein
MVVRQPASALTLLRRRTSRRGLHGSLVSVALDPCLEAIDGNNAGHVVRSAAALRMRQGSVGRATWSRS